MKNYIILGAGGHAKSLAETIISQGEKVSAYVDPMRCSWLSCKHEKSETAINPEDGAIVLGLGGLHPEKLAHRLLLLEEMLGRGFEAPPIIHSGAQVSGSASLAPGVTILAGAIIQSDVVLKSGAIINTGAIVEHNSVIEAGTHVAPGAIILGNCKIGKTSFVGAGAVVLQGQNVDAKSLIPALTKFSGKKN